MALRQQFPRRGHRRQEGCWEALLTRLRCECKHFQNADFRNAVTHNLVNSGTMEALLLRRYVAPDGEEMPFGGRDGTLPLQASRGSHLGGVVCVGRRVPIVEVRTEGMLDAVISLQEAGEPGMPHCNKVAVLFAAHPAQNSLDRRGICQEEAELLGRSSWGEVFFSVPDTSTPQHKTAAEPSQIEISRFCDRSYIQEGSTEHLIAENVWLLRHAGSEVGGAPGSWRMEPREFSAVCFLPHIAPQLRDAIPRSSPAEREHTPSKALTPTPTSGSGCAYADKDFRVAYHHQVEAALKACSLLDCDGLVVGCAEGICGSEIFGHR